MSFQYGLMTPSRMLKLDGQRRRNALKHRLIGDFAKESQAQQWPCKPGRRREIRALLVMLPRTMARVTGCCGCSNTSATCRVRRPRLCPSTAARCRWRG